ncbi:MAG: hypothetical protein ACRDJ4_06750, partial [Actinomycetota bacterium]
NAAGTYSFQAVYSGDANNNGATSDCTTEQVVVDKNSPTIATTPSQGGFIGVTLNDSATLSGATTNAGGKITFNLYDPDQPTCSGTPRFTQDINVSGSGTYSTTGGFVTDKVGTWRWTASYDGDGNNNGVSSGCNDEQVTVLQPTGKIAPTQTTCQDYLNGTAGDINQIDYLVKRNKISSVAPGVFFYYSKVTAPSSTFTIGIAQDITTTVLSGGESQYYFGVLQDQVRLFNADCTNSSLGTVGGTSTQPTIQVTGASAGQQFIVSVKYEANSIVGKPKPNPTTFHYAFVTYLNSPGNIVDKDANGLNLVKKK